MLLSGQNECAYLLIGSGIACRQGGDPAVLDPVTDLKLNQLEVVDSTKERQHLMQVSHTTCHRLNMPRT